MNKEEVKIYYYYGKDGMKYHTPSVEFASARAESNDGNVYYETYMVDVVVDKKDKK